MLGDCRWLLKLKSTLMLWVFRKELWKRLHSIFCRHTIRTLTTGLRVSVLTRHYIIIMKSKQMRDCARNISMKWRIKHCGLRIVHYEGPQSLMWLSWESERLSLLWTSMIFSFVLSMLLGAFIGKVFILQVWMWEALFSCCSNCNISAMASR